jgi:hypothetical protein
MPQIGTLSKPNFGGLPAKTSQNCKKNHVAPKSPYGNLLLINQGSMLCSQNQPEVPRTTLVQAASAALNGKLNT